MLRNLGYIRCIYYTKGKTNKKVRYFGNSRKIIIYSRNFNR